MKNSTLKKYLSLLAVILMISALVLIPVSVSAAPLHVIDNAGLLSDGEKEALSRKLDALSAEYDIDIAVATFESIGSADVWDFAHDFYNIGNYSDSGVLLLVSMQYREYAIYTTEKADRVFSESDLASLENAFKPDLSTGNYYDSFDAFADKCEHIIKYDDRLSPVWIAISLIVGAIIAGIVIFRMCSAHKNVKLQKSADTYMLKNTFGLYRSRDIYLYSHVTRVPKPSSNSSGRGGRSSGGRRGGGRSGRF